MATDERTRVQAAVEGVLPTVERYRDDAERYRTVSAPVISALREAGLLNLWTPREYGGQEVAPVTFMEAIETIARADSAAGWVFANMATAEILPAYLPEAGAREVYGNRGGAGLAGSVQAKGSAAVVDGGYRLTGRWSLVSGCEHAEWLCVIAVPIEGGVPRMTAFGPPDLQALFFPRTDCEVIDTWYAMGMRGTGSVDIAVNDVFVPAHRASSFFMPKQSVAGRLYNADVLSIYSLTIVSVFPGIARAAIDEFVALAKEKTPTLSQTGLATRPTIHAELARVEALVQSARAYIYEVATEIGASLEAGAGVSEELEVRRRLACVNTAASCKEAVERLFVLAGSTPIYTGHRLERCLRDVQTASQHLFASTVWWEKTGQWYFGLGLGMP